MWIRLTGIALVLAGCAAPEQGPDEPWPDDLSDLPVEEQPLPAMPPPPMLSPELAAQNFVAVVRRLEPVAEAECRQRRPDADCDFQIVVDGREGMPPNAYQTLDEAGRPIIAFTVPLIADARNADELAFILGHEAAHHIEGHIPRQEQSAVAGALIFGTLATLSGGDPTVVNTAQDIGATVGARRFSKDYELQADALGTVIAFRAGYDPALGAAFFARIPDPGNSFLGTHPPNARRQERVRQVLATLR